MTTTLTDRYIQAAVSSLPAASHDDVRAELAGSIADAVEARVEQGETPADAERAALTELGDPAALAAGLADRPLFLVGPRHYLAWRRLVRLLLSIVPVSVAVLVALAYAISGEPMGSVFGESIAAGITAGLHVCVWTTLAFAVFDRTGARVGTAWTPDRLAEVRPAGVRVADLVASLVLLGLAAALLLWDRTGSALVLGGERVAVLDPDLWPWWAGGLLVLIAAGIAFHIALFVRGAWTTAAAVANTALSVLWASWFLTLLGRGSLIDPRLVDEVVARGDVGEDVLRVVAVVAGFAVSAIAAGAIADGWVKRARGVR